MHVRGRDLWPAALAGDLVTETHYGRTLTCYPPPRIRTLGALLDRNAADVPDRAAVVAPDRRLTWRELRDEADAVAAGLASRHAVKAGDRVGVLLMNSTEFCAVVFACARLGAIAVTLNTKLRSRELEYMLAQSRVRVLVMHAALQEQIEPVRATVPCEAYYVVGGPVQGWAAPLHALPARAAATPATVEEDDAAFIMYTSGTTGRPKGAVGTHLGILTSATTFARCMALTDGEVTLVAVPLFHVTGLIAQFLAMAYVGGTTVVMPTFDAPEAVRLLDAERITHMIAAPTVFVMMRQRPEHAGAGRSLRVLGYGGAPTPPDDVRALRAWLPRARLHNAYGMTETCSPTTILPDADALTRISSVGRPVPVAELRTVDPERGRECAADEVGELWIRGPMVVPGYWADPAATASTMGDGWLRTGDLAAIDANGYVTIKDRIKDMINRGGEKIYCVEVEDVLCAHPAVLEAAVVGVPDAVYGETVRACVVPRAGAALDREDVRRFVAERLARFKVPREVVVMETLPRNPNGKVIKGALR